MLSPSEDPPTMRRRLLAPLLSAVVAIAVLAPATAVAAPVPPAAVLAAEGGAEGEGAPGLEPAPADDTENPAAPEDYEANFLWGAAVGLLALMILGALALGGLYWLMVVRPKRSDAART